MSLMSEYINCNLPPVKTNCLAVLVCTLGFCASSPSFSQNCPPAPVVSPSAQSGFINWKKFPDFTLPFINVYNGPRFGDTERLPLKKGFSHITDLTADDDVKLPKKNRAIVWYGVAYDDRPGKKQPWELVESPWGMNVSILQEKWSETLTSFANRFADTRGKKMPSIDLLVLDIERDRATTTGILQLKNEPLVPSVYKSMPDGQFVERYKRDMQKLYTEPLNWLTKQNFDPTTTIGSYSDVPIRNTFINIEGNTWLDWKSNPERVYYTSKDTLSGTVGGSFYNQLDILTPSAYYYYDYPSPFGGQYLSYLLFQVEANRAWSKKDIVVFEWMRFHDCCQSSLQFIRPFMAEASAIFPYFSGAKGIWLWDQNNLSNTQNYSVYEYFINGLYRLSQHKEFFEGTYQLYIPKSARDHFEDRDAIWRGVVKGNQILIAAHNPYAQDGQVTSVPVSFGSWSTTLELKGTETFLCKFDLPTQSENIASLSVTPNPNAGDFEIKYFVRQAKSVQLIVHNALGQEVFAQQLIAQDGENAQVFRNTALNTGLYIVTLKDEQQTMQKKFWVVK